MSKGSFFVGVDVGKVEIRAAVKRLPQKSCRFARYQIQQRSVTQNRLKKFHLNCVAR